MTQLTTTGLVLTTLAERITELKAIWASSLGATVDLGPDSPDGQIIGDLAKMFNVLDDIAGAIYSYLRDGASGNFLARQVRLNGITKNAGAFSTCPCTFTGTPGTVIPTSALIRGTTETDTTITWSPTAPITIGGGATGSGTLICSKKGDVAAPAGTLNQIQTVIKGWTSVTNPADATRGYADEGDPRLRARRDRSVAMPSQCMTDGLRAGILNLDNVTQAVVWENELDTPKVMAGGTLPPHCIYAVVDGGDATEIANAIKLRKAGGCSTMGSVLQTVFNEQRHPCEIRFSRPTPVEIWLEIDVTMRAGWISGTDTTIKEAIMAASEEPGAVEIGGDSNNEFAWSDVLRWIAGINGFSVTEVRMGMAENPTTPWQNVSVPFDAIARFDLTRIVVTVT
jgi:uncharacterized phage protein gp47/JayE